MSVPASNRLFDPSLIRFLLVGATNSAVALATIFLAKWLFTMDDVKANMLGYGVGIALSFTLNKRWTFRHKGDTAAAIVRFLIVTGIAYFANLMVVIGLIDHLNVDSYLSHVIGVIPYTLIGYLGSRFFVFRRNGKQRRQT